MVINHNCDHLSINTTRNDSVAFDKQKKKKSKKNKEKKIMI